jgi:hypothetical protein
MNFKFIFILLLNISLNFSSSYAQRRRRTTTTTTESNDYALNDDEIISLVKNAESASTSTTRDFIFEEETKRTKTKVNRLLTTTTDKTAFQPIRETTPQTVTEVRITTRDIDSKNKTIHKIKSKLIFI